MEEAAAAAEVAVEANWRPIQKDCLDFVQYVPSLSHVINFIGYYRDKCGIYMTNIICPSILRLDICLTECVPDFDSNWTYHAHMTFS